MLQRTDRACDIGEGRDGRRTRAEVGREGRLDVVAPVDQEADAAIQPVDSDFGGRRAVPELRVALLPQGLVQLGGVHVGYDAFRRSGT